MLLLLGTALYKGIYRRNKINNPYNSQFEEMTTGLKPTIDGRNPVEESKEKVQQEIKSVEVNEQDFLEEQRLTDKEAPYKLQDEPNDKDK